MAAPGLEHPHEQHLLDFLARHAPGPAYIKRTAEMVREQFPGSWDRMRPKLLALHRDAVKKSTKSF